MGSPTPRFELLLELPEVPDPGSLLVEDREFFEISGRTIRIRSDSMDSLMRTANEILEQLAMASEIREKLGAGAGI